MLDIYKKRRKISTLAIVIAAGILVAFWLGLQIVVEHFFVDSIYLEFLLLCFLGFGFLGISYLLKTG